MNFTLKWPQQNTQYIDTVFEVEAKNGYWNCIAHKFGDKLLGYGNGSVHVYDLHGIEFVQ